MIKFGGIDRIYDAYSWRITRKAKEVWKTGKVISSRHTDGSPLDKFEKACLLYTSPSPRDKTVSRMPSSA